VFPEVKRPIYPITFTRL